MIPQIGFAEMLVLALLAIIVVGPKDLPFLMRRLGQFTHKLRMMAQDFKTAFDDMAEEGEMAQLKREIEELKSMGKLSNLSDEALEEDMRALDRDIRSGTELRSPKDMGPSPHRDDTSKTAKENKDALNNEGEND